MKQLKFVKDGKNTRIFVCEGRSETYVGTVAGIVNSEAELVGKEFIPDNTIYKGQYVTIVSKPCREII